MMTYEYSYRISHEDLRVLYRRVLEDLWIPHRIGDDDLTLLIYVRST